MSYRVEFEPQAINDLEQIATSARERILRKINWLALKGDLSDFYKLGSAIIA